MNLKVEALLWDTVYDPLCINIDVSFEIPGLSGT
jgi:hypothetical protein